MRRSSEPARRLEIGVLHGFRALMVLFVANYHFWQQSWLPQRLKLLGHTVDFDFFTRSSYLFVDGMILLSGFLLYLPYARQSEDGTPVPGAGRFYLKRLLRIVPSYTAAVLLALVCFALPQGAYPTAGAMAHDVAAHLTFTFLFWPQTYLYTPLNGALWTLAVEMQFYLLFPLIARAAQKRPAITLSAMAALGWGYRLAVAARGGDTGMLINQMPAYLDVYALGMLGAMAYLRMQRWQRAAGPRRRMMDGACAVLFAGGAIALGAIFRMQSAASAGGHEALRLSQMAVRLPVAAVLLGMMLAAAHMPRLLQRVLDNRLMRFLSGISMNLYIWHQILAVQMRTAWFSDAGALRADPAQQWAYTTLCISVSVLTAMIATYGLERPAAKAVNGWIKHFGRKRYHEGPPFGNPEPSTDSLLLRAEGGRARAHRELWRGNGVCDRADPRGVCGGRGTHRVAAGRGGAARPDDGRDQGEVGGGSAP